MNASNHKYDSHRSGINTSTYLIGAFFIAIWSYTRNIFIVFES